MRTLIETDRLLIREITPVDKEDLFVLHSDPDVQKYTGEAVVESVEEIEKAIEERIEHYKQFGFGRWAIVLKDGMQFTGWAGLLYLPEFDEIDLGYRFLPQYWGKGIATEASHAILNYGFETLKLDKIVAIAMKENIASIKVMEKVGMEFYKVAPYEAGEKDAVWYKCDQNIISRNKSQ
ncbi:MAG: GNAT family N-acetyltransferase [Eudoraea sp.]|nr:GNAT family N-acetyltransferase [Eudoraea sp.]